MFCSRNHLHGFLDIQRLLRQAACGRMRYEISVNDAVEIIPTASRRRVESFGSRGGIGKQRGRCQYPSQYPISCQYRLRHPGLVDVNLLFLLLPLPGHIHLQRRVLNYRCHRCPSRSDLVPFRHQSQ